MKDKDRVLEIVSIVRKKYEDYGDLFENLINEWVKKRESLEGTLLLLINDFLLVRVHDLKMINSICNKIKKYDLEHLMTSIIYYDWAVYFASIGNKIETMNKLKIAGKSDTFKMALKEIDTEVLNVLSKEEFFRIIEERI